MTDCQHSPSLRYQRAQAEKRTAIASARSAARKRGPRIAKARETPPQPGKHARLLRDLLTMSESHLRDGNRRTAHCLTVAARVIAELQAEIDAGSMRAHNAHPGGTER